MDTDVIIAEEPAYGSTEKPEELYELIEHFCLGRRRIELFGDVSPFFVCPRLHMCCAANRVGMACRGVSQSTQPRS